MAPPPCMSSDGRPAVFVGTFLETGDSVALCDECLVPWAAAILAAMTGLDATPFLQAISDDAPPAPSESDTGGAPETSAAGASSDPPPTPARRGRTLAASREAGTAEDPAAVAPPASTDDAPPAA